jgi:hypothetical protein
MLVARRSLGMVRDAEEASLKNCPAVSICWACQSATIVGVQAEVGMSVGKGASEAVLVWVMSTMPTKAITPTIADKKRHRQARKACFCRGLGINLRQHGLGFGMVNALEQGAGFGVIACIVGTSSLLQTLADLSDSQCFGHGIFSR